jgi:hypothetical protein
MRKTFIFLVFLAITSISLNAAYIGNTNEEVLKVAEPIMDKLLYSIKVNDYTKCIQLCSEDLQKRLTKKSFEKSVEKWYDLYGKRTSIEYIGFLNKNNLTVVLWKAQYEKTKNHVMIKLVLTKQNGKIIIVDILYVP